MGDIKLNIVYYILAAIFGIAAIGCSIVILIEAFEDEIWKGILCLVFSLYFLYYAIFDFEHDNKWLIVLVSLFGSAIAFGFLMLAR